MKKTGPKRGLVTMRDVAQATGFSPATVSIVLNNAPLARYIAPSTRLRIEQTAKRLGYRPNAMARFLRSRRSQSIGVMLFDVTDPFCTPILRGIENALYPLGYLPIFADAHNQRDRFERYLEMLLERHVDGLIVVANWLFVEIDVLADLNKQEIPAATIGWEIPGDRVSSVMVDNETGGRLALEHLYQRGHRRIAIIRGPEELFDTEPRWAGVQRAAAEAGITTHPRLIHQLPNLMDSTSGFEGGLKISSELLASSHPFTAVLAFDDLTALGVVRGLTDAGLKVPDDCSVVGFDDVLPATVSTPGITTIRQPLKEMGLLSSEWTLQAINAQEQQSDRPVQLYKAPPELVVRMSTSRCPSPKSTRK